MRVNQLSQHEVFDWRSKTGRALAKNGVWTIAGFVGANTFVIGLLSLFHGDMSLLSALALALAGGLLTTFAWRSAYRVLDPIGATDATTPQRGRLAASGSTSGFTTLIGAPEA